VRLFSIYGVGLRKQLLWDGCRKLMAADLVFSGTGHETRDWLHVEDAATLLIRSRDNGLGFLPCSERRPLDSLCPYQ